MDEAKPILLIQMALLGDSVYSAKLISALPNSRFWVCCREESSNFYTLFSNVERVLTVRKRCISSVIETIFQLKKTSFSRVINFTSSGTGCIIYKFVEAPSKKCYLRGQKKSQFVSELINDFGTEAQVIFLPKISDSVVSNCASEDFLCVFVDSSKLTKQYVRFPLLIRDLANIGFKVLILGKIRHENLDFSSNVVNLTGKTSVKDCLYLVSRSAVVLSNDSFGAHLAMGYGKPLILFLCSTGDQHGFFQSELVVKFHPVQLTCWPCSIGGRALCPVSRCECIDYEYDLTKIVEFIKHFANKR